MTAYKRGDVVLVSFIFADESGVKKRPAVIISSNHYNLSRREVIVAAITSNIQRLLAGDYLIASWQKAGLLLPSVATGVVRTIQENIIERKLGIMPPSDMSEVDNHLRSILALG